VKGAAGWPTTPTATLRDPAASASDGFGGSAAVSGTTMVIGGIGTNADAGAAYVYVKGAAGWPTTPTVTLQDPGANANDIFSDSVSVSEGQMVIGAGAPTATQERPTST